MPPELKKYLFDMNEAASLIATFLANRNHDDFMNDKLLRSAVY